MQPTPSISHADLPQLEKDLRNLGTDLSVAYIQDDDQMYAALMEKPETVRIHADNLRILAFYMMHVKAPLGCISMSHPTVESAETLLQALGLFPVEDLAQKLMDLVMSGRPPIRRRQMGKDSTLWAHGSIPDTLPQISQTCGNLSLPAWVSGLGS